MARLPRKIKLWGVTFRVVTTKKLMLNGKPVWGYFDYSARTIHIDTQKLNIVEDTIIHEMVHAMGQVLNFRLTEEQTSQAACLALAFIKDNPKLIEYFLEVTRG